MDGDRENAYYVTVSADIFVMCRDEKFPRKMHCPWQMNDCMKQNTNADKIKKEALF